MKKTLYALLLAMITLMNTVTINPVFAETLSELAPTPMPKPSPQPPTITYTTGETTDVTDTSAIIHGSCKVKDGDDIVCSMFAGYFYYWTDGGREQQSELFYITGSSERSLALTDLTPDTVYYYRFGDGETKSFRTAEIGKENVHKVSALGDRLAVSCGGDYAAEISVPAGETVMLRKEVVTGEQLNVITNPQVTLNYVGSESNGSSLYYEFYSFVMPDEDVDIITAAITPVIPTPKPPTITYTTGEATDVTDTSAIIHGSCDIDHGDGSMCVIFAGYFYYWANGEEEQKSDMIQIINASNYAEALTGLTPDTVYYYRFGDGETKSFRTAETVKENVHKVSTLGDNSLAVSYGGDYTAEISVPAGETVMLRREIRPGDQRDIITNPKVTLNYAGSESGQSLYYIFYSFVMPDEDVDIITASITPVIPTPKPPTIIYTTGKATDVTDTSAVIHGSCKLEDGDDIVCTMFATGYFYYWADGGEEHQSESYMLSSSSEFSFPLTGLIPDTVYYYRFGDGETKSFRTAAETSPRVIKAYTEDDNTIVETFSMSGNVIIGASYDENGALIDMKMIEADDDTITLEGIKADKIFIWDSVNTMMPVCDVLEIR